MELPLRLPAAHPLREGRGGVSRIGALASLVLLAAVARPAPPRAPSDDAAGAFPRV
jgi:hypothetical protein